jgi:hypothetical protein
MGHAINREAIASPPTNRRQSAWPFMSSVPTALDIGVPRRQEVEFADGTRVWLRRVEHDGMPDVFLRDLERKMHEPIRVDLRRLSPLLAASLPSAAPRDVPSTVHVALRSTFGSATELLAAAEVQP